MRYFYVAPADARYIEDTIALISKWDEKMNRYWGLRVGILLRFTIWNDCKACRLAEKYNVPVFVDNGAFAYLTGSGAPSPKWLPDYYLWLKRWGNYITVAALPDLPVHGREFYPGPERLRRIKLSIRLHREFARMLKWMPDVLEKTILVLQGYLLEEYLYAYKSMREVAELRETCTMGGGCPYHGVYGVGSVCVRKPSSRGQTSVLADGKAAGSLHNFLREFLNYRWLEDVRGFHFFGLHAEAIQRWGHHPRYYASDTGAHGMNYKYKWRDVLGCRAPDKQCYLKSIEHQLKRSLAPYLSRSLEVRRDGDRG